VPAALVRSRSRSKAGGRLVLARYCGTPASTSSTSEPFVGDDLVVLASPRVRRRTPCRTGRSCCASALSNARCAPNGRALAAIHGTLQRTVQTAPAPRRRSPRVRRQLVPREVKRREPGWPCAIRRTSSVNAGPRQRTPRECTLSAARVVQRVRQQRECAGCRARDSHTARRRGRTRSGVVPDVPARSGTTATASADPRPPPSRIPETPATPCRERCHPLRRRPSRKRTTRPSSKQIDRGPDPAPWQVPEPRPSASSRAHRRPVPNRPAKHGPTRCLRGRCRAPTRRRGASRASRRVQQQLRCVASAPDEERALSSEAAPARARCRSSEGPELGRREQGSPTTPAFGHRELRLRGPASDRSTRSSPDPGVSSAARWRETRAGRGQPRPAPWARVGREHHSPPRTRFVGRIGRVSACARRGRSGIELGIGGGRRGPHGCRDASPDRRRGTRPERTSGMREQARARTELDQAVGLGGSTRITVDAEASRRHATAGSHRRGGSEAATREEQLGVARASASMRFARRSARCGLVSGRASGRPNPPASSARRQPARGAPSGARRVAGALRRGCAP